MAGSVCFVCAFYPFRNNRALFKILVAHPFTCTYWMGNMHTYHMFSTNQIYTVDF